MVLTVLTYLKASGSTKTLLITSSNLTGLPLGNGWFMTVILASELLKCIFNLQKTRQIKVNNKKKLEEKPS